MIGLINAIGNFLKPVEGGASVDSIVTEMGVYVVTETGSNYMVTE
jgi:hypothetical protein